MAQRVNGKLKHEDGKPVHVNGSATVEPTGNDSDVAGEPVSPDTIAGFDAVDPGTIGGDSGSGGTPKRGRGRPKGSTAKANGNASTAKETKASHITGLEGILVTIHMFAAQALSCPELQMAEEESRHLARAIQNVNEQYNTVLNPKVMAWVQLALVGGSIYGTRIVAIRARQLAEAGGSRPAGAAIVDIKTPKGAPDLEAAARRAAAAATPKVNGDARTPADLYGLSYGAAIPGAAPDIF